MRAEIRIGAVKTGYCHLWRNLEKFGNAIDPFVGAYSEKRTRPY